MMKLAWIHTIFRVYLGMALILPTLAPASYAMPSGTSNDASYFFCDQSRQAKSAVPNAYIEELQSLLGEDITEQPDGRFGNHCFDCLVSFYSALVPPVVHLRKAAFETSRTVYFQDAQQAHFYVRGPPVGGRAPPRFL